MDPSPPSQTLDSDATEESARVALAGLGCPRCSIQQSSATSLTIQLCPRLEKLSEVGGLPTGNNAVTREHIRAHAVKDRLGARGWLETEVELAKYLAERAPNVPRILIARDRDRDLDMVEARVTVVPAWAVLLLEVGTVMRKEKLSVGGVRKGSKHAPPDGHLVNWPRVLRECAANRVLRRAMYTLMESETCSPVGLRDWLSVNAPQCFGRDA